MPTDRTHPPPDPAHSLRADTTTRGLHSTSNRIRNLAGVIGKFISTVQLHNEHLEYLLLTEPLNGVLFTLDHFLDLKSGFL